MRDALLERGQRAMAVLLVLIMALSGLVMTRDVFNLFVFVELIVIASAGLVLLSEDGRAIAAGFKYLIVAQVISVLLLIGIIFTYHANGSLNIDDIAAQPMAFYGPSLALFLVLIALMLELKPFPANGWALDIYESAHPGFSALFSAASGTAALFAADKLFAAAGPAWLPLATGVGLMTFLGANVLALSQQNDRRLLGYSSVGQIGLVLAVIGQRDILGDNYLFVAGGILVTHAVAKAGLFWLSDFVKARALADWAALAAHAGADLRLRLLHRHARRPAAVPGLLRQVESRPCAGRRRPAADPGADPPGCADRGGLHVPLVRLCPEARLCR